jgi:carboxyl-terminal processing protease
MKKTIQTIIFITWICAIAFGQNTETAPKIISTVPVFGDCNVDPGINEIIIKFDQDMNVGMSLIDTRNMPKINGDPTWIDKRTFSIPVILYPNKLYSLTFNNSIFQNFTNISGIPLNPDELHFRTKSVSYEELNKEAYKELIGFFPKEYSYASLKAIDWKTVLEKYRTELEGATTNSEFALKLVKLLRIAEDPHIWVEVEGQKFETSKIKLVENNFDPKLIFQFTLLQNLKVNNKFMSIAGILDSVSYFLMRNWNTNFNELTLKSWGDSRNPEIPAEDILKDLFAYKNMIIDVRENTGGNENYAKEFASYFVKDSIPYEKVKSFNEKSGAFDNEYIKMLYSNNKLYYSGNIFVLSGPCVMSSNESFILMMKQLPNAKVVGMKTYGSSGNPLPHELSNGVKIYLPSWQAYTLDGKLIEGNGVEPDIEILTSKSDFDNKDVLIDEVFKMIKKGD